MHLIRRVREAQVHALVTPLVTSASGAKFGKTEAGAVWLDANKTSPFQYYQFWLNSQDADVVKLLQYFTLMPREEIAELEQTVAEHPEGREAQRRLAAEVTRMTHGDAALQSALTATGALFGGGVAVGNRRVDDPRYAVRLEDAVEGRVIVLRRGARQRRLVRLEGGGRVGGRGQRNVGPDSGK